MLTLKKYWHETLFIMGMLLLSSSMVLQFTLDNYSRAEGLVQCQSVAQITKPGEGTVRSGSIPLEAYIPPGTVGNTTETISSVKFFTDANIIGSASKSGSFWIRNFDTTQYPNGPRVITARVTNSNGQTCETEPRMFMIENETSTISTNLRLEIDEPQSGKWVGPTNIGTNFRVRAMIDTSSTAADQDVSSDAVFTWATTIGKITEPNGQNANFFSGPYKGQGKVTVIAKYGTETRTRTIAIEVTDPATTTYPDGEDDSSTDSSGSNSGSGSTSSGSTEEDKPPQIAGDPDLKVCIIKVIGEDAYKKVVSGERRLTFGELDQVSKCFAASKYVIPANVAPIEPERFLQLPEDRSKALVSKFEQSKDEEGNDNGIILSGISIPNKTILLYIFSEPLVLTTETDAEGNWTYVLEDPLEPGEHEVYVAVEDDNGEVYRSEALSFNIAQAANTDQGTNPTGLSLTLDLSDPETSSTIYYVSAVVAIMLIGIGSFVFIVRRRSAAAKLQEEK